MAFDGVKFSAFLGQLSGVVRVDMDGTVLIGQFSFLPGNGHNLFFIPGHHELGQDDWGFGWPVASWLFGGGHR